VTGSKTGDYTSTIVIGSATRSFEVIVGSGYNPNTPVPLTFVFPRARRRPQRVEKRLACRTRLRGPGSVGIFVFPAGVSQGGDIGWNESCGGPDVAFYDALTKQIQSQYCIATNRLFVAGFLLGRRLHERFSRAAAGICFVPSNTASGGLFVGGCTATGPALRLTSGGATDTYYTQADFMTA